MIIPLDPPRAAALWARLADDPDAEALPGGGYAVDLYDLEPPVSMELYPAGGGIDVVAAFTLNYDDALAGYYLGDKLETPAAVIEHLSSWSAWEG